MAPKLYCFQTWTNCKPLVQNGRCMHAGSLMSKSCGGLVCQHQKTGCCTPRCGLHMEPHAFRKAKSISFQLPCKGACNLHHLKNNQWQEDQQRQATRMKQPKMKSISKQKARQQICSCRFCAVCLQLCSHTGKGGLKPYTFEIYVLQGWMPL
jgi:hypothetical protein